MSICESIAAALLVELYEGSGLLSPEEATKVNYKLFDGKDVMGYDEEYQAEPVA